VTPHTIANVNALIFFDALIADVTVVFFELLKKGFLKIFLLWHSILVCCGRIQDKQYQCKIFFVVR